MAAASKDLSVAYTHEKCLLQEPTETDIEDKEKLLAVLTTVGHFNIQAYKLTHVALNCNGDVSIAGGLVAVVKSLKKFAEEKLKEAGKDAKVDGYGCWVVSLIKLFVLCSAWLFCCGLLPLLWTSMIPLIFKLATLQLYCAWLWRVFSLTLLIGREHQSLLSIPHPVTCPPPPLSSPATLQAAIPSVVPKLDIKPDMSIDFDLQVSFAEPSLADLSFPDSLPAPVRTRSRL